jgi:hypothetical protein
LQLATPPHPAKCDAVGLARIDLDGTVIEDLTPELPIPMRSVAYNSAISMIAWTWNWEVPVMPLHGGGAGIVNEKLTAEHLAEFALDPAWSPDGSELLYRW